MKVGMLSLLLGFAVLVYMYQSKVRIEPSTNDVSVVSSILASSELCLLAGDTPVGHPPSQSEFERYILVPIQERAGSLTPSVVLYMNMQTSKWNPGMNSDEPVCCLIDRATGGLVLVGTFRGISRDPRSPLFRVTKEDLAQWRLVDSN